MVIRPATSSDIPALTTLAVATYTAAFGHTLTPPDLAAHLQKNLSPERIAAMLDTDTVLVAEQNGELVGYIQCGPVDPTTYDPSGGAQELRRIYVASTFQNQGVGKQLLDAALAAPAMQSAARIVLDVWERNLGAIRFYQRNGFHQIGARKFEVASGAETDFDLIMVREKDS